MIAKILFKNCIKKLKKKGAITSRNLLIVLFGGLGFLLFLSFNFEPQQINSIFHLI